MAYFENMITIPQCANQIIVDGNLSTEDIHSLVLTSKVFHGLITDPSRAQFLWQKALPYASAFLFNRTVRVFTKVSESQGVLSYYRVHSENNRQSVQKTAAESREPALILSGEVKVFFDRLISCYQTGKLDTLDDFVFFRERHAQDFPQEIYNEVFPESTQENGRLVNYQEVMHLALQVMHGHERFKAGTVREDQFFEQFIRGFVTIFDSLPLRIDELPSLLYLLGSSLHRDFSYTVKVFTKVWDWVIEGKISPVHLVDGILEAVKFYHLFEAYVSTPEGVVYNSQVGFGPTPQVTNQQKELLDQRLVEILNLPDFSLKTFNRSVSADIQHRDVAALLEQLNRFIAIMREGHLTFKILAKDYSVLENEPFLLSYCTEGLLTGLREGLLEFNNLDHDFFKNNPFFFQLEDLPHQGSSIRLQALGTVYLDFCRALKTDLSQYKDGYDDIFLELIARILNQCEFADARDCFDNYVAFDLNREFDEELRPFFTSVQRGDWTAQNLLVIYKDMRAVVDKMLSAQLQAVDQELYQLYQSSVCHRIFFRFLVCEGFNSIQEADDLKGLDSLTEMFSLLMKRTKEACNFILNREILFLKPLLLSSEFREFIRLVGNDFSRIILLLHDQKFAEVARFVLAFEAWLQPSFRQEIDTFQEFLNMINSLIESKIDLYKGSIKYGIKQSPPYVVLAGSCNVKKQTDLSLILREPHSVVLHRDIVSSAFNAFASVFDERASADLVDQLLKDGHFLLATILRAHGLMTGEQYEQMLFMVMKSSILARTKTETLISDTTSYIRNGSANFIKSVFDYVLKDQSIDYEKCFHKIETDFMLAEDDSEEEDVLEDEMGE